jgi:hypothetical protein
MSLKARPPERRASAAGLANVEWRQVDPATAVLDEYDLGVPNE